MIKWWTSDWFILNNEKPFIQVLIIIILMTYGKKEHLLKMRGSTFGAPKDQTKKTKEKREYEKSKKERNHRLKINIL